MNPQDQAEFDRIVKKATQLTDAEVDFLYARRSYLKKDQLEEFQSVLDAKEQAVADAAKADEPETKAESKKK